MRSSLMSVSGFKQDLISVTVVSVRNDTWHFAVD
jgi:hypothetical protein